MTPAVEAAKRAGIEFTLHEYDGRRGLQIELRPQDLVALTGAAVL